MILSSFQVQLESDLSHFSKLSALNFWILEFKFLWDSYFVDNILTLMLISNNARMIFVIQSHFFMVLMIVLVAKVRRATWDISFDIFL